MQGVKRKRRCQMDCTDHIFSLQCPKTNSSKYDIKLLFCPKYQREPLPPEQTYPEYNNDGKFYTSAFLLGGDKKILIKNDQQELMDHQKHVRDSLQKHNQLVFPRPSSKHSLCSVCKEHYKNYYLHISSEAHRQKISQNLYNNHIKKLCNLYKPLWEGAEERADEQAERKAAEQEQKRQKLASLTVHEDQREQSQAEGEDGQDAEEGIEEKVINKNVFKDDQTIPWTNRTAKRTAPQHRKHGSEYISKRFIFNQVSSSRNQRERQERRYERERDKLKTQRDNPDLEKEIVKVNPNQGDVFFVVKTIYKTTPSQPQTIVQNNVQEKQTIIYNPPEDTNKTPSPIFVWKRTTDRFFKKLQQELQKKQQQNQSGLNRGNSRGGYKKQITEDKQSQNEHRYDRRFNGYYSYPPPPPFLPPYYLHNKSFKEDYWPEKRPTYDNKQMSKHKDAPYHPYIHPPLYQEFGQPFQQFGQVQQQYNPKDVNNKHYEYPFPPWAYHPDYLPPPNHKQQALDPKFSNMALPSFMYPPYYYPTPPMDKQFKTNKQNLREDSINIDKGQERQNFLYNIYPPPYYPQESQFFFNKMQQRPSQGQRMDYHYLIEDKMKRSVSIK